MKKLTFISCLLLSGCLAGAMAANKKQPNLQRCQSSHWGACEWPGQQNDAEEKVQQLNQYTLRRNNNENNRGEEVKKIPATLGSLIYFDEDANLRNELREKQWKNHVWVSPSFSDTTSSTGFRTIYPISLGQACSWKPQFGRSRHVPLPPRKHACPG